MREARGAWVVTRREGGWIEDAGPGDYSVEVICVAETEALARAAAEHHAKKDQTPTSLLWANARARPTYTHDDRHEDGFWVIGPVGADGRPEPARNYCPTFGFEFVEAFIPARTPGGLDTTATRAVLDDVLDERHRQHAKWGRQDLPDGTGQPGDRDGADSARKACVFAASHGGLTYRHILDEEVAEVMAETEPARLRTELVQVAAVAVQWVEEIDRRAKEATDAR